MIDHKKLLDELCRCRQCGEYCAKKYAENGLCHSCAKDKDAVEILNNIRKVVREKR